MDVTEILRLSRDQQFNFRWPLAIDQRLDDLVSRANSVGANTSRKEVLSALLLSCELEGDQLMGQVTSYRTATVGQALLDQSPTGDNVVSFPVRRPGRRAGRS